MGAASIDTGHGKRDTHLRGRRFLDVEKYPSIVMTVQSARTSGTALELAGEMAIKGVREPPHFLERQDAGRRAAAVAIRSLDVGRGCRFAGQLFSWRVAK
ncbi:hypothetical protein GCM10027176_37690 [Actinoallomurus bryophytorum]|uniref:YceI family protein n=1 Tax=Actinoallomurus bryophytorum TaxID=1490222 RepID=UPI001639EB67|nr:YceI family protein [Actinoallomurus bryophytorum]